MGHRNFSILGALVVGLALVFSSCAQPAAEKAADSEGFKVIGSASGYVVGPDGLPIKGVKVTYNTGSRAVKAVTTNAQGFFEITDLISGTTPIFIGGGSYTQAIDEVTVLTLQQIVDQTNKVNDVAVTGATTIGDVVDGQYSVDTMGVYRVNLLVGNLATSKTTLYPLTASVKGIALLEKKDNKFNIVTSPVDASEGYTIGIKATGAGVDGVYGNADDEVIPGIFTATIGKLGAFSIAKLPASFPNELKYEFFVISSNGEKKAAAFKIDGSTYHMANGVEALPMKLIDGGLVVDLGNVFFKAAIAPIVTAVTPNDATTTKFLPADAAGVATPLVFTFSAPMNTLKGTLTVSQTVGGALNGSEDYLVTKTWSASSTVLTVAPLVAFEYGAKINASFSGFQDANGVLYVQPVAAGGNPAGFNFETADSLNLVTWSYFSPYSSLSTAQELKVALDASPTYTFNLPLVSVDQKTATLKDASNKFIPATFSVSGAVLTVKPTAALLLNKQYTVYAKVNDGKTTYTINNKTFNTVQGTATLAVPTFTFDDIRKLEKTAGEFTTSKYNGGQSVIQVNYTELGKINEVEPTYTVEVRSKAAGGNYSGWTQGIAITEEGRNGANVYGSFTLPSPIVSGTTYDLVLRATHSEAVLDSVSAPLSLTDGIAPLGAMLAGSRWNPGSVARSMTINGKLDLWGLAADDRATTVVSPAPYITTNMLQSAGVVAQNGSTGIIVTSIPTTVSVGYMYFDVILEGGEAIGSVSVNNGTLTAAEAIFLRTELSGDTARVFYQLPKSTATHTGGATGVSTNYTYTFTGRTVTIMLTDAAGTAPTDYDSTTGTQNNIVLRF